MLWRMEELCKKGYVRSFQEAFDRFLKKGAPAYVDKVRFKPEQAISFIRESGGVAVLAHPKTLGMNSTLEHILLELMEAGLKGIEVFYPEHNSLEVAQFKALAKRYGLLMTGGTDYHGIDKEELDIGVGRGEMRLPYSLVEGLKAVRTRT